MTILLVEAKIDFIMPMDDGETGDEVMQRAFKELVERMSHPMPRVGSISIKYGVQNDREKIREADRVLTGAITVHEAP